MKGNIPIAGPKYRLGMYFETIHNLNSFDVMRHDEGGYTSFWETDTEADSELGNFIFNNVSGDSASLICLDDTIDLLALRKCHRDVLSSTKCQPHYKLEQNRTSPSEDRMLDRSIDNKHSSHSRQSHRSGSDGTYDLPPPVPPPRRQATTANTTNIDFEDHTYETLDDCYDDYMMHQDEMIYISKGSDDYQGHGCEPKQVSNDDTESDQLSSPKEDNYGGKSPIRNVGSGGSSYKPKSTKTREPSSFRQRRKVDESTKCRKRRAEKVACKDNGYPVPVKGFPAGVAEEYADYLALPMSLQHSPERNHSPGSASPIAPHPCQRDITSGSHDRRRNCDAQKSSNLQHNHNSQSKRTTAIALPLVIKHKGKTYLVPVVDKKLEKELEKRSRTNNPTVSKYQTIGPSMSRSNGIYSGSTITGASNIHRLHVNPAKVDQSEYVSPHKRKPSSKSLIHTTSTKQVTHYGVL